MRRLTYALVLVFAASSAMADEWGSCPTPKDSPFVAACFKHDDGGTLFVMCDTKSKIISIALQEPRASWQAGAPMDVITRADDGTQYSPSHGVVIGPTQIVVKNDSTWDISTMGSAKSFFAVRVGDYTRIFPTAKFRQVVDPVLRACGDHW